MLFNSLQYAVFLPIVFLLYWLIDYAVSKSDTRRHTHNTSDIIHDSAIVQNLFLLIASYLFYGWWDWRFLGLLFGESLLVWIAGLLICRYRSHAKAIMLVDVVVNLLILGLFKYYNFFLSSFCSLFGLDSAHSALRLILPLGISFFTFQAISYVVDIYRGNISPFDSISQSIINNQSPITNSTLCLTLDSLIFCLLYIGFFPKLLAGPIERPSQLLPQIRQRRVFSYDLAIDGCRQFLWGLFKKIVIADNCAVYVNTVWGDYSSYSASTLFLAAVLYTIQIYGDFSGYSDMALGSAKLFGFRFRDNFLFPYFSRNMGEFWRRWHISLNTWFVDYVYIPLGGSRCGKARTIANTMIIFLLSGLWHGADWSFVCWGGYHGLLLVILILCGLNTRYDQVVAADRWLPSLKEFCQMILVFLLATFGWMMFRADNMQQFLAYLSCMCDSSLFVMPAVLRGLKKTLFVIFIMFVVEWLMRRHQHGLQLAVKPLWRWILCYAVLVLILLFHTGGQSFIYFNF